jgi:hypothetical protein
MSVETFMIQLRAIISMRNPNTEIFFTFAVSKNDTIRQLMDYINLQLRTRYSVESNSMYYMFNEFQTTMNEEARLGGVLLPEDCIIGYSMIEHGCTLFIQTEPYVEQAGEDPAVAAHPNPGDELEEKQPENPPVNQYQQFVQNIFPNIQNQPVVDIDMDNQARLLDVYSVLDIFSRVSGVAQPRPAVNPIFRIDDIFRILQQVSSIGGNVRYGNLQDVVVGLDPTDLEKLKSGLYKDLKDSNKHKLDTCSICFDPFKDDDECRELKCCHMFHQKCVDTWLTEHITCPVCREETGKGVRKM